MNLKKKFLKIKAIVLDIDRIKIDIGKQVEIPQFVDDGANLVAR